MNDVSAGADPAMFGVVGEAGAGIVLMHMKGEPKTMQDDPTYYDVVAEVRGFLGDAWRRPSEQGSTCERLCIDPGIGFGKTLEHNLAILHDIRAFLTSASRCWSDPAASGSSATLTDTDDPDDRIEGTAGAVAWCAARRRRHRPRARRQRDDARRPGGRRDRSTGGMSPRT